MHTQPYEPRFKIKTIKGSLEGLKALRSFFGICFSDNSLMRNFVGSRSFLGTCFE